MRRAFLLVMSMIRRPSGSGLLLEGDAASGFLKLEGDEAGFLLLEGDAA